MKCTFFGHRNTPPEIERPLCKAIIRLIEGSGADTFYVGHQGAFDTMVLKALREIKQLYPRITYYKVLAYMPRTRDVSDPTDYSETLYPSGLENTPPKFAISKRNRWMIGHSDIVVTYVTRPTGGAALCKQLAERQGKQVVDLAAVEKDS